MSKIQDDFGVLRETILELILLNEKRIALHPPELNLLSPEEYIKHTLKEGQERTLQKAVEYGNIQAKEEALGKRLDAILKKIDAEATIKGVPRFRYNIECTTPPLSFSRATNFFIPAVIRYWTEELHKAGLTEDEIKAKFVEIASTQEKDYLEGPGGV